ncbi:pyridoxal phosphate-dependent transferase [Dipodascopsis tothii]|uniref:pyridoxal phosphate-dependent transferase n=1 Tax=Dipodascopsis tothii TaxID=44089 RepID=UPI0034CFE7AF
MLRYLARARPEAEAALRRALMLDKADPIAGARSKFLIPTASEITQKPEIGSDDSIYLCGNSLGLQPRRTRELLDEELGVWARSGVYGHFRHDHGRSWVSIDETVTGQMASIVGAAQSEVAVMGTLTANLHLAMASFFKPTAERHKVIIERRAFPSDHYAVESQIRMHGGDPENSMVLLAPRDGAHTLATADIVRAMEEHADSTALVLLPGVQYYTGQALQIETITREAKRLGLTIGWDMAHAAGNLDLKLHDWDVDFAVWCSYKYLNSGPGGIAGLFVHDKQSYRDRLTGWWGHEKETRFVMDNKFRAVHGAAGYQVSNPSVLDVVALRGSLDVFADYSMTALREKSVALTAFLEDCLRESFPKEPGEPAPFTIITPTDPSQRGAQLSLLFRPGLMETVYEALAARAVVVDDRKPDVIRVAPTPLYNTFTDVWEFVETLREIVAEIEARE